MHTRKCPECGAEFTTKLHNKKYCSKRCARNAEAHLIKGRSSAVRELAHAWESTRPVPNSVIMTAKCKPANTSAVRWRMELRRRANPKYYEMVEGI
jgi:hypothetical protein